MAIKGYEADLHITVKRQYSQTKLNAVFLLNQYVALILAKCSCWTQFSIQQTRWVDSVPDTDQALTGFDKCQLARGS
jgi:hypothetical protein